MGSAGAIAPVISAQCVIQCRNTCSGLICSTQELQLNILQQSQLLQAGETAKSSGQLHQLQTKQQQLVAQLQVILMELVGVAVLL